MKISITMGTFNGAKWLQEQLDSFVNQTRQLDEFVVYDGRSTENTLENAKKVPEKCAKDGGQFY